MDLLISRPMYQAFNTNYNFIYVAVCGRELATITWHGVHNSNIIFKQLKHIFYDLYLLYNYILLIPFVLVKLLISFLFQMFSI
jgi:hypothetical protein